MRKTGDWDTWAQIAERARKKIPEYYDGWTDHNAHDPGITLVELFAWLKEAQVFYMNQIGRDHLKKYLKLLGIRRKPRSPGHGFVTVKAAEQTYVKEGTRFYAGELCFETRRSQMVAEGMFDRLIGGGEGGPEILAGDWMREGDGISLYPFGRIPKRGDRFTIALREPLLENRPYRLYVESYPWCPSLFRQVEEEEFGRWGFYPLGILRLEYHTSQGWRAARAGKDGTYGFTQPGSIRFSIEEAMDSKEPRLRFVLARQGYLIPPRITRLSLSMTEVWQQETAFRLPPLWANGFPDQLFDLRDHQICELVLHSQGAGGTETWKQVDDFDNSGPMDSHYRLEDGVLIFGDGIRGRMPEGQLIISRLVRTRGEMGNVKAGSVDRMAEPNGRAVALPVVNERDMAGGCREESVEEAVLRYLAEEFESRAVTGEDYEKLIRRLPGLLLEDCRAYSAHPDQNLVTVAVKPWVPEGFGTLNRAYEENIRRFLEDKRLIGTRLQIVSPDYYPVEIHCEAVRKVQFPDAERLIKAALAKWMEGKGFGEGIAFAKLYGLVDTHPCVRQVISLWVDAGGRGRRNEDGDLMILANGVLKLENVHCTLWTESEEKL